MTLDAWVKKRDPARNEAKNKLDDLPRSVTAHGKAVPFPFADKNDYKKVFNNKVINSAIESASKKSVKLSSLHAIQHSVKDKRVTEYLDYPVDRLIPEGTRDPKHRGLIDTPIVIHFKGKKYIHDGHHRLTAEKLAGKTHSLVRYVDLDNIIPSS